MVQRVDDRACAEEQQRLEERVRGEVIHRRRRAGHAHGHDHVAELRERRVSEDAFDVVLLHRHHRGHQGRNGADPRDDVQRRRVEDKKDAAEQVNARCHHRRRVNQRADRRGALHGIGQPHVQRELRGFADRAAEDEESGGRRHRPEQRGILF